MKGKVYKLLERINYPILAVILVIVIGSLTLFFKPYVGMANNGDFYRIMINNNLYYPDKEQTDKDYFNYFEKDYGISEFYNDNPKMLISTQSLVIKPAIFLDKVFTGNDNLFDIRFLGAILLVIHAIAAYLIIKGLTYDLKSPFKKLILTLLYVLIFMDTGYIAYFNSFFGEGVNIPFFLLSIGIMICMIKFNKVTWYNIILFSLITYIFIGSKQQLAPTGILVAILIFRMIRFDKKNNVAIIGFFTIIALILGSLFLYKKIEGDFDYINRYHALNRGILLYESDPEKILEEMGINKQYALLQGTNYFEAISQINLKDENLKKDYYDHFTMGKIIEYYAKHPTKIYKMAKMGFKNAYYIRPAVLGNYERSAGKEPGEKSYFFSAWSSFKTYLLPKNLNLSIVYIIILAWPVMKIYFRERKDKNGIESLMGELFIYIFLVGLLQIIASLVGAGDADLTKHEFMYNMSFDMMVILFTYSYFKLKEEKREAK